MNDENFVSDPLLVEYLKLYLSLLREYFGDSLVSVCLFGSVARGEHVEGSDIDMLVVVKELKEDIGWRLEVSSNLKRIFRSRTLGLRRKLRERKLPTTISDILLTPEEISRHPPIILDLTVEGKMLFDRENFLSNELERVKERLKELGARRVKSKSGWYWILKPGAKLGEVIKI